MPQINEYSDQCYVGLKILCGIVLTFSLNIEIFCSILSVPQNTIMDLDNVMISS